MQSIYHKQVLFIIFLFIAFLIVIGALIFSGSSIAATLNSTKNEQSFSKKKFTTFENDKIVISESEEIKGDVLIIDGSININGKIFGDVYAKTSKIIISKTSIIYGNVICFKSTIKKEEGAKIGGDIINISIDDEESINKDKCQNIEGYDFKYHILKGIYDEMEVIDSDETIDGDLIVVNQDVTIAGKIDGDLINMAGDILIAEKCAIDGHIINLAGTIELDENMLLTGQSYNIDSDISDEIIDEEFEQSGNDEDDEEIREAVERKYLRRDNNIVRFFGNVKVEDNEILSGDVVVMRGHANIKGEVQGDVVAIFGNIELDSTGYVSGDVVSVGGRIYREDGSYVGGDVVQTSWTGVKVDDGEQHVNVGLNGISIGPKKGNEWRRRKKNNVQWDHNFDEFDSEPFMVRYNRVEGLFLGYRQSKNDWSDSHHSNFNLYGHIGYGFKNKRARYKVGLERSNFDFLRMTFGIEAHDLTNTEDKWIISTFENSLAAFIIREDFQDFYRNIGASGYISQHISSLFRIKVGYHEDKFYNMDQVTNWSVFGGSKKFRSNPIVDEYEIKSVRTEISFDTRNDYKYPTQGWYINLMGEFAGKDFNDKADVNFDRYIVDIRRYQPIGYGENLDIRLRAGSARGYLPIQYQYDLGGISTLRGYEFKEFQNKDRMLLANLEYRMYGINGLLDFDELNLILFTDAGLIWDAKDKSSAKESFDHLTWNDFNTSIGLGISNYDGNIRLNIAKRLDEKNKPVVLTIRIRRPF